MHDKFTSTTKNIPLGSSYDRDFTCSDTHARILEQFYSSVEFVKLLLVSQRPDQHQIGADGEIFSIISDHEIVLVARLCYLDRFVNAPEDSFTDRIGFAGKLQSQHSFSDVMKNDFIIVEHRCAISEIRHPDFILSTGYEIVFLCF